MDKIWYAVVIILLTALILALSIGLTPEECEKVCTEDGFSTGFGVSMRNNETCETKFNLVSQDLASYKTLKAPSDYKNMCCCEK